MSKQTSLANKILLFVYPTMYLIMFVVMAGLGYWFRDNPVKLVAATLFAAYLFYRLVFRVRKLFRFLFPGEEAGGDEDQGESTESG